MIPRAPLASDRSASATGSSWGLIRQKGISSPPLVARGLEHHVVGRRVPVELVHREHEGAPRAGRLQPSDQLRGSLAHAVGVVLPEVRVRVEQLEARDLIERDLGPGLERIEKLHHLIRTMKGS